MCCVYHTILCCGVLVSRSDVHVSAICVCFDSILYQINLFFTIILWTIVFQKRYNWLQWYVHAEHSVAQSSHV